MSEITEGSAIAVEAQAFMSEQINEIAGALAKAQGEMGGAKKGAQNPHLKNKYADLASVMDALKEPLAKNGLAITQLVENEGENVAVRTLLIHSSGQWLLSRIVMPYSAGKGVNEAQAMGSVITYMRRYQASGITGLHQEDSDMGGAKDAKPAEQKPAEPAITFKELSKKIVETKAVPHLANLWKKYAADMGKMSEQERKDLAILKDTRKYNISAQEKAEAVKAANAAKDKPEEDPTLDPDYQPSAGDGNGQ